MMDAHISGTASLSHLLFIIRLFIRIFLILTIITLFILLSS